MIHLVVVHLGPQMPNHLLDCIDQFRLFNPPNECQIHLLVDHAVDNDKKLILEEHHIVKICNQTPSPLHQEFNGCSHLDKNYRNGFFHLAAERFLVIYDYLTQTGLTDVFHIEYDNLVYVNLLKLLPVFQKYYKIAVPTDAPTRVVPSFMYFCDGSVVMEMVRYMVDNVASFSNEMHLLKACMNERPNLIQSLPLLTKDYTTSEIYTNHSDEFQVLFDACAFGQYLGGVDPRNISGDTSGFINETTMFRVDQVDFEIKNGVPYACNLPLVNLHIHSKDLRAWSTKTLNKTNVD